ncbi:putative collagen-binding protein [Terriglobus roseus DSM 18391]|uniref:Putative collagen-binding protein n=1 Tax=Terriglobus roseus (strain DSM 18391 / NRRL B-41598 / KBS 63) TaxID=926566 RepID=I3ZM85_TERRK|nr:carboxypeptidase regulatory-like domain-containing protein [Terriglobus roseus]AFL90353.1 putative collagen-binding protein [Terriglobus roseus DSM 18391]
MSRISRTVVTSALMLSALPAALAQQSVNGTIRGRALDPSGAAIPNATVTVTNPAVGFTKTVTTGGNGLYVLPNLPLGEYTVQFVAPSFSTLTVKSVVLNAGSEASIDGEMVLGEVGSSVSVVADNVSIDPTNLNIQRTLDSREVENLPLTSRNPYNFIIFQPGVSGHPNAELGIPRTINTNGLLDRINYQMDGMLNTESDRIGLRFFPVGTIFVKEVQEVANSFAPEYGWTTGNVYNVISNNGTNAYHGMFQFVQRWVDATAYPLLSTTGSAKPNLELRDYSGNLGGRIIKDKLFFFGSYEQVKRGSPSPVTVSQANINALGIPAEQLQAAPGLLNGKFALGRLDWTINKKNQAMIRYNYFVNDFPYNTQVGGINLRSTGANFKDRAHVFGGQLITTVSDHLLNEFRISLPLRSSVTSAATPTNAPTVTITNVVTMGASSSGGTTYYEHSPNGSENISYTRGAHSLKAGFTLAALQQRQRLASFNTYTFASIAAYQQAVSGVNPRSYNQFSSQTDTTGIGYASLFYGGYAQDTWQVAPRLVVVGGLRYDRFQSPNANPNAPVADSRTFRVPAGNFAPRLGFSFKATDKTVFKASAGIFYQQTPTNLWFNALNSDGSNRINSYTFQPTQTGAPAYPNIPSATGVVAAQNVLTVSPKIKNEYTWNFNTQLTQQLGSRSSFTVGYILSNGRNLMYLHNINLQNPVGSLADGRPVFNPNLASTKIDTRFNQINRVESGANSSFNALVLNYSMSPIHGLQFNANYTWSHTITDAPEVNTFEQNTTVMDTTNYRRDRGNSLVNRPSAFNMTAVLEPTFHYGNGFLNTVANGNRFAILANLSSGDQANLTTSTGTLNGDSFAASVQRPAFVGRNTFRSPNIYQFDARYTRTFGKYWDRLEPSFLLEANNVFNHRNITGLTVTQATTPYNFTLSPAANANAGVATGAITTVPSTVLEARIVQWGFAVRF